MFKLNFFMCKRSDMSLDQFGNYWREHHGPLALDGRTTRLGMQRYIQNYRTISPLSDALDRLCGKDLPPYEGICQLWFQSEAAVLESRKSVDGAEATNDLAQDEGRFLDLPNCAMRFYKEEMTGTDGASSGSHKIILGGYLTNPGEAGSIADAATRIIGRDPVEGLTRTVQNIGLDTPANAVLRAPRNNDRPAFDYMLELTFRDYVSAMGAIVQTDGVLAQLISLLRPQCINAEVAGWIAQERAMIAGVSA